jgi:hypothetical protein
MADLTIAVSEAVCAKTLEVVVANFGFDVADRASFGSFMAIPEGRLGSRTPKCARGRSGSR